MRSFLVIFSPFAVVDAMHIIQHLDEVKPDGVENESVEQVAFADRILLNKIDLVTPEYLAEVKARLRAINSDAQIIETQQSVRAHATSTCQSTTVY